MKKSCGAPFLGLTKSMWYTKSTIESLYGDFYNTSLVKRKNVNMRTVFLPHWRSIRNGPQTLHPINKPFLQQPQGNVYHMEETVKFISIYFGRVKGNLTN